MNLSPAAADLLQRSVAWMDRYWDAEAGLLWEMGEVADATGLSHATHHIVRESAWYALGLLMRDRDGDVERAARALHAVLAWQFDEPERVYHGTFRRAPEEPHPLEYAPDGNARIWKHYDPNWREFIVTTFMVILDAYEARLPRSLVEAMDAAIRRAVEGSLTRPLTARYTNIALMNAVTLVWAGARLAEPGWTAAGEAMGRAVYGLFKQHDAFEEYNSPTYYGPDIFALELWQHHCQSPELQQMGAEIEELVWRDVARFYHAGLRNVAGPYDRSYGMDMCRYVALLGAWIWLITGRAQAPFPDVTGSFAHAADFCFGPLVAMHSPRVPADVIPHFFAFQGERLTGGERVIERVIGDSPNEGATGRRRTVTAWLSPEAMIGAQHTSLSDVGQGQFHPATLHWDLADWWEPKPAVPQVGWVRLKTAAPVDAVASPHRLAVTGLGTLAFHIHAAGLDPALVTPHEWTLPNLLVRVTANTPGSVESASASATTDGREDVIVRYAAPNDQEVRVTLDLSLPKR